MLSQQEQQTAVLSAIKDFARSSYGNANTAPDTSRLIEATSEIPLSNLDQWELLVRWNIAREMHASAPAKWQIWKKPTTILTWFDLCSVDGFRREKTLQSLSDRAPNRFCLALAIRRLNDWVPQVRDAACKKLLTLAKISNPDLVADVLCVTLVHWNSWGRMGNREVQTLLDIASLSEVAFRLKMKLLSSADGPMPTLLSQLGRVHVLDSCLEEIAHQSTQPAVRAKAYKSLLEGKITWIEGKIWKWTDKRYCIGNYVPVLGSRNLTIRSVYLDTLCSAVTDASPIVRRVACEILIRNPMKNSPTHQDLAERLAADRCPSVAQRGKFALKMLVAP